MGAVTGLYEHIFAARVSDRERLLAFWSAFGFEVVAEGALTAAEAEALYGHRAELTSLRLRHPGCATFGTGQVRLHCWSDLAGSGLGAHRPLVTGSRWMGMYTADILEIRDSLSALNRESPDRWLSDLVSAPLAHPPPDITLQAPFVGLRETLYFDEDVRVAFIQRGGFDRPGFGTIDMTSLFKNSEGSHGNVVQPSGAFDTAFYKRVFGLETAPYGEAHDSGSEPPTQVALRLEVGQLFRVERLRAPDCPTGLLQVYAPYFDSPDHRALSRAGQRGLCLYSYRLSDLALDQASGVSEFRSGRDEFGEAACTFSAPDGYQWMCVGA
jgi:catechol 2,3-dioxygenase-like lactoylglutathione lyase family enzyme